MSALVGGGEELLEWKVHVAWEGAPVQLQGCWDSEPIERLGTILVVINCGRYPVTYKPCGVSLLSRQDSWAGTENILF